MQLTLGEAKALLTVYYLKYYLKCVTRYVLELKIPLDFETLRR